MNAENAPLWSHHEDSLRCEPTVLVWPTAQLSNKRQSGCGWVQQIWVSGRHSKDKMNWSVSTDARMNGQDTAWERRSELPNCLWEPRDYYRETPKSDSTFSKSIWPFQREFRSCHFLKIAYHNEHKRDILISIYLHVRHKLCFCTVLRWTFA